jgi:protein-tyrosine phosphatase
MIPLVDMHCHLLAGLDDGPGTEDEALDMCRIACNEGVGSASATAHQNEHWCSVTPERIRQAAHRLSQRLHDVRIPFTVFPCAEVMVQPEVVSLWQRGDLLSVADHGQYLLVEMPHGLCVDLRGAAKELRESGVRLLLAHPERHDELLHDSGRIEQLIQAGCLVQVSSSSITEPANGRDERALKSWFMRGVVHCLGSDGHSPSRRPPHMANAYRKISRWIGVAAADRIGSTNGMAISQGLPLRVPAPQPPRQRGILKLW